MLTLWRKDGSGTVQSDPERSKTDPNLLDAVYDLIKENHAISRAELARRLETSERQVRKAIDELRDKKIRRKDGDSGEWEIIDKERSLLRLAKRQSRARQAQDERMCLERGMMLNDTYL